MKLNAPKVITWWIAVALAVLGVIGYLLAVTDVVTASWLMPLSFWIEVLAAAILAVATAVSRV